MKTKKNIFETEESQVEAVRINKFLADSGVCSRRGADKAVEEGKVTIDGEIAVIGSKVYPGQEVTYCGKVVSKDEDLVLIAFNKPVGIECTTNTKIPDNVIDYINYGKRIFPIGRLDKESEGLLLLTNDGDIVNKVLRAGNYHEKEYIVTINKEITPEFLRAMASGVPILDTVTRPCKIEQVDRFTFRIILTQGLNRQIRRMCEALNCRVRALTRVRIMNINLGRLKTGCIRNVTPEELERFKELIEKSSNAPIDYSNPDVKVRAKKAYDDINEGMIDEDTMDESLNSLKAQAHKKRFDHFNNKNQNDKFKKQTTNNKRNTKDNFGDRNNDKSGEKKSYNRVDRSSFTSSKSLRAGRPGNHQ